MELFEAMKSRRSIRRFKADPVSDEYVDQLLEAARLAPSGLNIQPWRYVVVKDETVRRSLAKTTPSAFIGEAPVILVCCADMHAMRSLGARVGELVETGAFAQTALQVYSDGFLERSGLNESMVRSMLNGYVSISVTYLMLRAADLGLGTCWIGSFDSEAVKHITGLDERYSVIALLPVGFHAQAPKQRPRLALNEILLKTV